MLAALRFVLNATRGHRLRPWRSEYVKWRIETYSGIHAETIAFPQFAGFIWQEKSRLLRFLAWTAEMDSERDR